MNIFSVESNLAKAMTLCLEEATKLDALARSLELQNKQWFLDWQDKLNELSVR